jgi:hypothetical protein
MNPLVSTIVVLAAGVAPAAADPLPISPGLYFGGNLRVRVVCADGLATEDNGLRVTLDGLPPLAPVVTNGASYTAYTTDGSPYSAWEPTDVGFVAPPGHHHLAIAAPGCTADERDLDVSSWYPKFVTGRLAISDPTLEGPVGAPDGIGITLGASTASRAAASSQTTDLWGGTTAITTDATSMHGGWLALSYEHRSFVFATDLRVVWAATSGTVQTIVPPEGLRASTQPLPFTGTTGLLSATLRIGARLPLHDVALAVGTGLGGAGWIASRDVDTSHVADPAQVFADSPNDHLDGGWYVPVWGALTIKPGCGWGIEALATYDVHPTALDDSGLSLSAGLLFQPSSACAERPAIRVTPP